MWAGGTPSCFLPADGAVVPAAETTAAAGTAHEQRAASSVLPALGLAAVAAGERPGAAGICASPPMGALPVAPRARAVCEPGPQPAGCLAWPPEAGNG